MTDDTTNEVYDLTDDQMVTEVDSGGGYTYTLGSSGSFNYSTSSNITGSLSSSLGGGGGLTGQYFPTMGSLGSSNWGYNNTITTTASPYISTNGYMYPNTITSGHTLQVNGDTIIEGNLTVKGVNLSDRLDQIEQRLGILRPNNDLEGKWEELKALGDQYRQLEKEILEKESMWDILKK